MQARQPRREDGDFGSIDTRKRLRRGAAARQIGIPLTLVRNGHQKLERSRIRDESFVQRRRTFGDQAERDLPLQEQRIGRPAPQRDDGVSIFHR